MCWSFWNIEIMWEKKGISRALEDDASKFVCSLTELFFPPLLWMWDCEWEFSFTAIALVSSCPYLQLWCGIYTDAFVFQFCSSLNIITFRNLIQSSECMIQTMMFLCKIINKQRGVRILIMKFSHFSRALELCSFTPLLLVRFCFLSRLLQTRNNDVMLFRWRYEIHTESERKLPEQDGWRRCWIFCPN